MAKDVRHISVRWPAGIVVGPSDVVGIHIGKHHVVLMLNGAEIGRAQQQEGKWYAEITCSPPGSVWYTPPSGFEVWD
jgi:hypothetical protein